MNSQQLYTSGNLNSFGIRTFSTKKDNSSRGNKSNPSERNPVAENESHLHLRDLEELNTILLITPIIPPTGELLFWITCCHGP